MECTEGVGRGGGRAGHPARARARVLQPGASLAGSPHRPALTRAIKVEQVGHPAQHALLQARAAPARAPGARWAGRPHRSAREAAAATVAALPAHLNPKSCRRLLSAGCARPPSTLRSKASAMSSLQRRLRRGSRDMGGGGGQLRPRAGAASACPQAGHRSGAGRRGSPHSEADRRRSPHSEADRRRSPHSEADRPAGTLAAPAVRRCLA